MEYMSKTEPLLCWCAVSLQDIHMRKAFQSSSVQDQEVVSRDSASSSVADLYNSCDRPPPLSTLTAYRWITKLSVKSYLPAQRSWLIRASCLQL